MWDRNTTVMIIGSAINKQESMRDVARRRLTYGPHACAMLDLEVERFLGVVPGHWRWLVRLRCL